MTNSLIVLSLEYLHCAHAQCDSTVGVEVVDKMIYNNLYNSPIAV